jgi:putative transposase
MISPVIDGEARGGIMISFKGAHVEKDIMLTCGRWYVAYPLSDRQLEERVQERGVTVDHSTINRWVLQYAPQLEEAFHRRKRPVWRSWRMDETYIKVKGRWYYLYRGVDKAGQTIDFLLTAQRDRHAAKRFLTKTIRRHRHGVPEKITIDGSEANAAAIRSYNEARGTAIVIRARGVACSPAKPRAPIVRTRSMDTAPRTMLACMRLPFPRLSQWMNGARARV